MHKQNLAVLSTLGIQSQDIIEYELIQELWSGYGHLLRVHLNSLEQPSIIIKSIRWPTQTESLHHPRGWNTSLSHQRKLNSYNVELNWYAKYSNQMLSKQVATYLGSTVASDGYVLVIEDLRTAGLPKVIDKASPLEIVTVLNWLADFHAFWMGSSSEGLWDIGTYWHLATRPDEHDALQDKRLKAVASKIDDMLNACPFQTLVHGDAKLANFCFSEDSTKTAAVDFQYVGRGIGMKDVVLFLTSVISFDEHASQINDYLDVYFNSLATSLSFYRPDMCARQVEQVWRPLFGLAWADFQRFMKGWCPTHFKVNPLTEAIVDKALREIGL